MSMRVGLICHRGVGGSVRVAVELAGELAARGHDVHLFARSAPLGMTSPPPGVTLHVLRDDADGVSTGLDSEWSTGAEIALVDLICEVVNRERLQLLHFHYAIPFGWVLEEVRWRLGSDGPAVVGTLHGTDVSVRARHHPTARRLAAAFAGLDGLTTVSHSHALLSARLFGLSEPPEVIPNFVVLDRFRPWTGDEGRRPRIVHVSNFRPVKQPDSMARIAASVLADADAELWIVGDGEMMPFVESILAPHNGRVQKLGVRLDVERVLPHTDLMLVTSRMESFCLVALEAMAAGVPVIAPRTGGLPELIEEGVNGLLFEPDDEQEAARLILEFIGDQTLRERLRAGGLECARRLSSDTVVPRYEQLYGRVVTARQRGYDVSVRAGG